MKLAALVAAASLAGCLAVADAHLTDIPGPSPDFALDSIWDDGKAEVLTYATTDLKNGLPRTYETHLVLKKKAGTNKGPGALEMIYASDVDLDHCRATVLFDRKTFRQFELTASSTDSSHTLSVRVRVKSNGLEYFSQSDRGDRALPMPLEGGDAVFYDALPIWLRGFNLSSPARIPVRMLPTQLGRSSAGPGPAEIEVIGYAGRPSDTSRGGLEVDVHHEGTTDRMWFHPGPGHVLLVWEKADGTTLTLSKSQRLVYEEPRPVKRPNIPGKAVYK